MDHQKSFIQIQLENQSKSSKLGRVIVGLLTDEAISSYKNPPLLSYSERKEMLSSISFVDEIIEQKTLDYVENLRKIKKIHRK